MAAPQIMSLMIDFVETKYCDNNAQESGERCDEEARKNAYNWKGYFYGGLMLATTICQSILLSQYFARMYIVAMNVRTALIATIYRKSLRMSSTARKESTVGEIVNLMSVDVQRFMVRYILLMFHYITISCNINHEYCYANNSPNNLHFSLKSKYYYFDRT